MKIMLVGLSSAGHRAEYLEFIAGAVHTHAQVFLLCPKSCVNDFQITDKRTMDTTFHRKRTAKAYVHMLRQIRDVAREEQTDIIHFLEADEIYRYFGIGLSWLSDFRVIMTFHHLYLNNWRKFAIQRIMEQVDCSIVHTRPLADYFSSRVKHSIVKHVEYPAFHYDALQAVSPALAKQKFALPTDRIIVGLLGGTLKYKGYHFLLDNLSGLEKKKFHFLFVGSEGDYKQQQIKDALERNQIDGTVDLHRLPLYEFHCAVQASDIILLPYGKDFNGASGPLAEGVCAEKMIIGSDYESLGFLIKNNHVGYTFEVENGEALIKLLNQIDVNRFAYDETASNYRDSLKPEFFGYSHMEIYRLLISG